MKPYRYREEAMATHFEILICHPDKPLADSLAGLAFRELDRLEDLLSRFRDGSDVVRINQLQRGETILISEACHECLRQAIEIQLLTNGRFDIATGGFMELLRDREGNSVEASQLDWEAAREARKTGSIKIDPTEARVVCEVPGLQLDLGGIGKGYALESLTGIFEELEVGNYLISAGGSTLLARGNDEKGMPWSARLSGAVESLHLQLGNESLSGSGFEVKGSHIVSGGSRLEQNKWKRVWVKGTHAALVDGLSTACYLMDASEISELLRVLQGNAKVWAESHEGKIIELGC